MNLTPSQQNLLKDQVALARPPKLSTLYKDRTRAVLLTHFDHVQPTSRRRPWLFSLLGGSLVVAVFALIFSYALLRSQSYIQKDPELSTLQDDLQSLSIPTESFE